MGCGPRSFMVRCCCRCCCPSSISTGSTATAIMEGCNVINSCTTAASALQSCCTCTGGHCPDLCSCTGGEAAGTDPSQPPTQVTVEGNLNLGLPSQVGQKKEMKRGMSFHYSACSCGGCGGCGGCLALLNPCTYLNPLTYLKLCCCCCGCCAGDRQACHCRLHF